MAKLKAKLFFLLTIVLFSLATFTLTIFNYNPFKADYSVFVYFYLSLFLSLTGVAGYIVLFVKSRFSAGQFSNQYFWPSIRQGALISLILTALLLLRGLKILDLWVGIPLTVAIILLELFFRGNRFKKT